VVDLEVIRRRLLPCSGCGTFAKVRDRLAQRRWRHVPCWGIPVVLRYRPTRVRCASCGIKVEAIPWSAGKSPIALPMVSVLATWSRLLAWDVVGELFGVRWATVCKAVEVAVEHGLARRDLSSLRFIGIDEISRKKRHVYHTNVYDLERRVLIWSGEGRKTKTIEAFFTWLGEEKAQALEGVCCDMWAPYVDTVALKAPNATMVFDKFHIVANMLRALDEVRRKEARSIAHANPELLKKARYLFLKNPENLTDAQRFRLGALQRGWNLKTLRGYAIKEELAALWTYRSRAWAKKFFDRWFCWATRSQLEPIAKFAWTLRRHEDGVLAWFDIPIDNGAVEAMNNNAKAISHRARGYRTARVFTLAMLHCMGGLELPEWTVHRFA
ncbi:MAG: ISL3 family transposase, partial [bacterium]